MVAEIIKSVKHIVDAQGKPSAAVVDILTWGHLLEWLEDKEDMDEAREALEELAASANDAGRAGWLHWDEVRAELNG